MIDCMATRSKNRKSLSAQPPDFAIDRDWLWGLILVLAVILAYQPVWLAGFIWDDARRGALGVALKPDRTRVSARRKRHRSPRADRARDRRGISRESDA